MPAATASNNGADRGHLVFLAGSISGVAEGVTIQPLEMLKTRFQINEGAHLRILPTIKGQQTLVSTADTSATVVIPNQPRTNECA